MATVTGLLIRQELERYGLIKQLGQATATGAATYLTDVTRLQGTSLPATIFDGGTIRATAAGGSAAGEIVFIDILDADNGFLYVTPDWSGSPTSAVTYEIWRAGIDSNDADKARDQALIRDCAQWYLHPLSEVSNAAYVEDLGASNWQVGGVSNETVTKATLAFPVEYSRDTIVLDSVDNANSYAESASMYVQPGQAFFLHVAVSARGSATAGLKVRDITNSADITLTPAAPTKTGQGWTAFNVTGTVPSGCFEITVRLISQGATDVCEWGPVYFHWQGQKRIDLPARIISRDHVGPIGFIHDQMGANSATYWGDERLREIPRQVEQVSDNVIVRLDQGMENRPYFYIERAFFSALQTAYLTAANRATGDTATTLANREYVAAATALRLATQYKEMDPEFWSNVEAQAGPIFSAKQREFGPRAFVRVDRDEGYEVFSERTGTYPLPTHAPNPQATEGQQ
jgi:hypothetical protein